MKLALKTILMYEASISPRMARIIKASDLVSDKDFKKIRPETVLPILFSDLKELQKSGYKASDQKLVKALNDDIQRLTKLMTKLRITIPKTSIKDV